MSGEIIRRIVDVTIGVNLCYSGHSFDNCVKQENTNVFGSPLVQVLHEILSQIESCAVQDDPGLESGKYIKLSAYREENIDIEANFSS